MAGQTTITVQSDGTGTAIKTLPACGQDNAAGSLPMVLSSDQGGTPSDTATPDITANGASFTFTSLLKGMVVNTKAIASALTGVLTFVQQPFRPIAGATKSVTVGPTATAAGSLPLAANGVIPAGTATSYRVRNAAASASPVTWILTTDPTKTPVIPTPAAADGTGGAAGDKTIDPGSVEIISLSAAQQTALAAGTLYLSAVTPAGGSAVLSITPGVGA